VLEELGMQAAGLKREFYLTEVPVDDTIEVRIVATDTNGDTLEEITFERDIDWEYIRSRNSIRFFTYVPNPLSQVLLSYDILAGEKVGEDSSGTEDTEDTDE
jgi:hypothetical protein